MFSCGSPVLAFLIFLSFSLLQYCTAPCILNTPLTSSRCLFAESLYSCFLYECLMHLQAKAMGLSVLLPMTLFSQNNNVWLIIAIIWRIPYAYCKILRNDPSVRLLTTNSTHQPRMTRITAFHTRNCYIHYSQYDSSSFQRPGVATNRTMQLAQMITVNLENSLINPATSIEKTYCARSNDIVSTWHH